VAGVGAATVSHDDIAVLGKDIDDFALAFIAPL
jgi:adenine deaminase